MNIMEAIAVGQLANAELAIKKLNAEKKELLLRLHKINQRLDAETREAHRLATFLSMGEADYGV